MPAYKNFLRWRRASIGESSSGITVDNQDDPPAPITTIIAPGAVISQNQATVVGIVVSATDPWDTSSALFWLRLLPGQNTLQLYARETVDDDWILAGAAIGAADIGDGFTDVQERRVGVYTDFDSGDWTGLSASPGSVIIECTAPNGDLAKLTVTNTLVRIQWAGTNGSSVTLSDAGIVVIGLPTTNPSVAGALWDDAGTLKISTG